MKYTAAAIIAFAICLGFSAVGSEKTSEPTELKQAAAETPGNFECIGRGFVNLGTCYFELPRCILYDNADVPFWGFIQGAATGTVLTAWRAFGGMMDILSLGFSRNSFYSKAFPEYAWDAKWFPEAKQLQQSSADKP